MTHQQDDQQPIFRDMQSVTPDFMLPDPQREAHFEQHYATSGHPATYYQSAYAFGAGLTSYNPASGYKWADVEPYARSEWETAGQTTPWDDVVEAVRHGWESLKDTLGGNN